MSTAFRDIPKSEIMDNGLVRGLGGLGGPFQTVNVQWHTQLHMPLEQMSAPYKARVEEVKEILNQHLSQWKEHVFVLGGGSREALATILTVVVLYVSG